MSQRRDTGELGVLIEVTLRTWDTPSNTDNSQSKDNTLVVGAVLLASSDVHSNTALANCLACHRDPTEVASIDSGD